MYVDKLPDILFTTTKIKIQYDCCGKQYELKWVDADKNYRKNDGKHICKKCGMKNNNPASSKEVREKMKQTSLQKYGTACPLNTSEHIAARVDKMFGTEEAIKSRNEKTKQTNLERYGSDHIMKTEEGIQRLKESMQNKYGVDFPLQSEKVQEKMRKTCQERYGVDNPGQVAEMRIKMAQTTLERYGVEYYNQLPEMKDYLRNNCKEWLAESYADPWAKGIKRPEEWNTKQRETVVSLILEGKWFGGYGKGKIQGWVNHPAGKCIKKNPYFRSYLELFTHIYFNETPDVEWYDFEPFSIEYTMPDESIHLYIVDFAVKFKTDSAIHLIETKPKFKQSDPKVQAKEKAALLLAECEGIRYYYYDEKFVKSFGYDLREIAMRTYVQMRNQ